MEDVSNLPSRQNSRSSSFVIENSQPKKRLVPADVPAEHRLEVKPRVVPSEKAAYLFAPGQRNSGVQIEQLLSRIIAYIDTQYPTLLPPQELNDT